MSDHAAAPIRSGSCLCRGVTFRVSGQPLRVGLCHCADCRKSSGAPYAAYAVWPIEAYDQESGYTSTYANRSFCTTCGGRVAWLSEGEAEVPIGSLDEVPTGLAPEYELWTTRREHWLGPLPEAGQFVQDRPEAEPTADAQASNGPGSVHL
ncbi:GFA family protein [Aminobacter sp. HY435]|uniref:GFA family protein n=1 Tax=Aminobacter sp. HY435 TaxID=2970917 RepID=UPI0022B9A79E|nr:GFA family protein [Aminobacter sp. HY435]